MLENLSSQSKELAKIKEVTAVILLGSHARGEAGRKSDVDLLVLVDKRDAGIEDQIAEIVGGKESRVIPSVLTPQEFAENRYFAFDILRDGIVLYKRAGLEPSLPFARGERALTLYSFDISTKNQSEKVKINRALYGGTNEKKVGKKMKTYRYLGIVEQLGGRRVGKGCFLVPSKAEDRIDAIFKEYTVRFQKSRLIEVARE